jgi:hypothetical protein
MPIPSDATTHTVPSRPDATIRAIPAQPDASTASVEGDIAVSCAERERGMMHPFEKAGLGKAPFRFVGMAQQDRLYGQVILNREEYEKTGIALTTTPGGTCAFCGTGIIRMYDILSADGKRFHVGCECVNRTEDKKLVKAVAAARRVIDRAARKSLADRKDAELKTLLADDRARAKLSSLPHPNAYKADQGCTMLDYAEFMATHSGAKGTAKVLRLIKTAIG